MRAIRHRLFSLAAARNLGAAAAAVGILLFTAACGQKGSLYRADDKAQAVPAATTSESAGPSQDSDKKKSSPSVPAPQSQKKDRPPPNPDPTDPSAAPPAVDPDRPAAPPPGN